MGFICDNELEIRGGEEKDRRAAAALIEANDSLDEDSLSVEARPDRLALRFQSVDGLVEADVAALAPQFRGLSFRLVYFSKDGEFFGYDRFGDAPSEAGGAAEGASESADLEAADLDEVGRVHDGDGLAFVKARYLLG